MESRLNKYKTFAPQADKWGHDKRQLEDATKGLELLVAKNFSRLALPCIAIYPDMDIKTGTFRGFKVAAPDGPLKDHFDSEEVKGVFFKLLRDATSFTCRSAKKDTIFLKRHKRIWKPSKKGNNKIQQKCSIK